MFDHVSAAVIAWSAFTAPAIADGAVAAAVTWLCVWCLRHWDDAYDDVIQDIADMIMPMKGDSR